MKRSLIERLSAIDTTHADAKEFSKTFKKEFSA